VTIFFSSNFTNITDYPDHDTMASSQLPEYQYTPLPHEFIRIVTLHPGAPTDPLRISINTRYLPFCPAYTAVSYVWGSNERPHLIDAADTVMVKLEFASGPSKTVAVCPGQATGTIRITENLRNLLINIRPPPEEKRIYVWVDSICINQEDQIEKTAQVKLMGRIFAHAEKTIFYMGEDDEISRLAFKAIKVLNMVKDWPVEKIPVCLRDVANLKGPDDDPEKLIVLQGTPDIWRPFILFLTRPWFSRTWIIQEVVVSNAGIVTCGRMTLPWEELVTACQVVDRSRIHELDANRNMIGLVLGLEARRRVIRKIASLVRQGKHDELSRFEKAPETQRIWHILSVIQHARNYHATDPRDKIFALIDIAGVPSNIDLEIDYSIPLDALYTKVAKAFIYRQPTKPLFFLSLVDQSYYTEDLPTYIADWRRQRRSTPIASLPFRGASRWHGHKTVSFHFLDTKLTPSDPYPLPRGLLIAGCRVLTIKAVEDAKPHGADWHALTHASLINAFPEPYPTTHLSYSEAFAKSINPQAPSDFQLDKHPRQDTFWQYRAGFPNKVRDRPIFKNDIPKMVAAGRADIIKVWNDEINDYTPLVKNAGAKRSDTEPVYTQRQLYETLPLHFALPMPVPQEELVGGRQWFISEDGFMGLVPQVARRGDVVVHLFGGDPLFVLRRKGRGEDGKERWGFLGEAFVLGLMDGEVEFDMDADKVEMFLLE